MTLDDVLARLEDVHRNGAGATARCPAHPDRSPSLSVSVGRNGSVLVKCHAGCHLDDILAALGLTKGDLYDTPKDRNGARIAATYDYTDAEGRMVLQVVRFEPKDFRQRRPDGAGGWLWNLHGVELTLYRLPQLLAAVAQGQPVYVCEGEKDVDRVRAEGVAATCGPMGAGKWAKVAEVAAGVLKGADVIVVTDRDPAGYQHARTVAASLADVAASVVVVEPAEGKDVSDHLAAGHHLEDLVVLDVVPDGASVDLDALLAEDEEPFDWAVPGLIERSDRIILTGVEGQGKSTLLRQIGVQLASGLHPFGGDDFPPLRVLVVDAENTRRQVRRKLPALRDAANGLYPAGGLRFEFRPDGVDLLAPGGRTWLAERVEANRPVDVLIIGPLYKLAHGDPVKEEPALATAAALDDIRTRYGCAVLIEAHSPYADGARSRRPIRPYGASLWSRWPEFGIYLSPDGHLEHWRGPREERTWPQRLQRGEPWPWMPCDDEEADWHGPTACMAAVLELLTGAAPTEYSGRHLYDAMRAHGHSFRRPTVTESAERLALTGRIKVRSGPRGSRLYAAHEPSQDPAHEPF